MTTSTLLFPKPPTLLRVSESQAISSSSSFISSTSSLSLFDRFSGASSGYLTDPPSPFTPSTAEFGIREGEVSVTQPSDSPTKEQASLPNRWGRHDRALFSPQSRLPQRTNASLINRSGLLDRACALGPRSFARSCSQNGTPFLSLIPISAAMKEDRKYHPDSEDNFDAITILRNRLERGTPTVATRRALELMDSGGRPPAACLDGGVRGTVKVPVTVVVTAPDSPVEDWSSDFELGSDGDVKVCPEPSSDLTDQLSNSESELDEDWLNAVEVAAAHSSILFPSVSDHSLRNLPSKPVLNPVVSGSPCSPFILATPDLSYNQEDSCSSLSALMAESLPTPIPPPVDLSVDEEEMARIMHTFLSFPTRTERPFTGSPQGDVDVTTVMRLETAAAIPVDHLHPRARQTRTLIGLGVAMPAIYPPLPPTLFPFHHPPGATLNSRSLRDLGYQSFDDEIFEIEQNSLAILSRNVNEPGLHENIGTELSFDMNESFLYSPLGGCIAPSPPLPEVDSGCSNAFQIEQTLSLAHTPLYHSAPIIFGRAFVGLGFGCSTEASAESQPPRPEPSPTTGRHDLVSADESIAVAELAPPLVSDFHLPTQNSFIFEPSGAQKSIELDASQLERQSALHTLEHADLLLDHIYAHSPPIKIGKRTDIERQLLAGPSKKQPDSPLESRRHILSALFLSPTLPLQQGDSGPCTLTTKNRAGAEQPPRSEKHSNERNTFSKRSYQALKKFGLERLAIFQSRSGRDDLDLTSPTVTPQDDPRSPYQSTMEGVFLAFTSINPPSEMDPPTKNITTSTGLGIKQASRSAFPMDKEVITHSISEDSLKSSKSREIGLGLPSHLALRQSRLQETSSTATDHSQSRRFSQAYQTPTLIVTEPSFAPSYSSGESVESPNQFLRPSHFAQRPLYDIIEVPTPPSSSSSSPRGTPSPRNQWSSPFTPLNPPRKKPSSRPQLSTPSTGSPLTASSIHADTEVGATNVVPSPEVPVTPIAPARRAGFKKIVSKFARDLFRRSRSSLKPCDLVSSPVLIEYADAAPGLGLLRPGASCDGFTPSGHKLQLLF